MHVVMMTMETIASIIITAMVATILVSSVKPLSTISLLMNCIYPMLYSSVFAMNTFIVGEE